MSKIVDVGLVTHGDATHLLKYVREAIVDGWQPYGTPYLDKEGRHYWAIVKYEQESRSVNVSSFRDENDRLRFTLQFANSKSFPAPEFEA